MLRAGDIEFGDSIYCAYDEQSTNYYCVLTFTNLTTHQVYLFPGSTFGEFMVEHTNMRELPPKGEVEFKFTLKSTNLISQTKQQIVVFASTKPYGSLFPPATALELRVGLKFTQHFVDDPEIQMIIKGQVEAITGQGAAFEKEGKWGEARQRYQEAFQLFRSSVEAVVGTARCGYQMRDWDSAIRDMATAVILDGASPKIRLLRSLMLLECYSSRPDWQEEIVKECHKQLTDIKQSHLQHLSVEQVVELNNKLDALEKMPFFSRLNVLKEELFVRAVQKYHSHENLHKYFPKASDLQSWLGRLESKQRQHEPTPEEIIDPIGYVKLIKTQQIMQSPYIMPSGNSIERKSLQLYFKTNGYKDPVTRVDIHPAWVFPNNNLQSFIRNHPRLKQWQQYEYQIIHE